MTSTPLAKTLRRLKIAAESGEIQGITFSAVKAASYTAWYENHARLPPHGEEECLKVCTLQCESMRLGFVEGAYHILHELGLVPKEPSHDGR